MKNLSNMHEVQCFFGTKYNIFFKLPTYWSGRWFIPFCKGCFLFLFMPHKIFIELSNLKSWKEEIQSLGPKG